MTKPTTIPTAPKCVWTSTRRRDLARFADEVLPTYWDVNPQLQTRDFEAEAKKKFPVLFAEIEKHNTRTRTLLYNAQEKNKKARSRAIQVAKFGTDAECEKLAAELLALQK